MTLHLGEKKFLGRTLLVSAAVLGMLAFAGAPQASAQDYDRCQRRIAKWDHKLHEAIEHHGWYSRQAEATGGIPIAIGMTTITIGTKS